MMLKVGMYVRCPADVQYPDNPRIYVCGQVQGIDEISNIVTVKIHDPFNQLIYFDNLPKGTMKVNIEAIDRCSFFVGSTVYCKRTECDVLATGKDKDNYQVYYLENKRTKEIFYASEINIIAPFNNGNVNPTIQMGRFELQNPSWFFGRKVVSRSMDIINNSMLGFKELAGSKIYLLPHQVNTVMRCLQHKPCRYMLADEVGMGKTIEALSVLKILFSQNSNYKSLLIVPKSLKEQWKAEILLKFGIALGNNINGNYLTIKTVEELTIFDQATAWDLVIIDEVHKYLQNSDVYRILYGISEAANNIILLSATPVQERKEEYLKLLKLLDPSKYGDYDIQGFQKLIDIQEKLVKSAVYTIDDIDELESTIKDCLEDGVNPRNSTECIELFDDISANLDDIAGIVSDKELDTMINSISMDDEDYGVSAIRIILSYICSNYQIESNVVRNRRRILEKSEEQYAILPKRKLIELPYTLDFDNNSNETRCYEVINGWAPTGMSDYETYKGVLSAFFSSASAFYNYLKLHFVKGLSDNSDAMFKAKSWFDQERDLVSKIQDVIDDPDAYEDYTNNRLYRIICYIYDEIIDEKVVLFTDNSDTFALYQKALSSIFEEDELSFFDKNMEALELEVSSYKFQSDPNCRIILCDSVGCEGKNFQCADYLVHIDIPWDVNLLEQRIGRLDRLERAKDRQEVVSLVPYAEDSFESALFKFWNDGLMIFSQSLSGMEIIMGEINAKIKGAVQSDFKFGLMDASAEIKAYTHKMREIVRKQQNFDAAALLHQPLYTELERLITYYSKNDNELFSNAMREWASLSGFIGHGKKDSGIINYSETSFSLQSAINSMFIPPKWNEYLAQAQNKFINSVRAEYLNKKSIRNNLPNTITGTFERAKAIENDYIRFFAPGDELFDSIVDNALHSCKGRCSAIALLSDINWKGFILTWSIGPKESLLYRNGVSPNTIGLFRNYLFSRQVVVPYTIDGDMALEAKDIIREYNRLIASRLSSKEYVHLGKRTREAKFLKNVITEQNVEWFKKRYSDIKWRNYIKEASEFSLNVVNETIESESNFVALETEMRRILSSEKSRSKLYGLDQSNLEVLEKEYKYIVESLKNPFKSLDSMVYVWMVKGNG